MFPTPLAFFPCNTDCFIERSFKVKHEDIASLFTLIINQGEDINTMLFCENWVGKNFSHRHPSGNSALLFIK